MTAITSVPVLCGSEPGSFAEDTIVRRLPEMARRVIAENEFDEPVNKRLSELAEDLPHGQIRSLHDRQAVDWHDWEQCLQPWFGQNWLEIPLFTAEMYFYRRVLEATGYFLPGSTSDFDPYLVQKRLGLEQAAGANTQVNSLAEFTPLKRIRRLIALSLWANQADLSLWPVKGAGGGKAQGGGSQAHLVADQAEEAMAYIRELDCGRVDLILDNFGSELVFDLLMADAFLEKTPRLAVRLHVRPHPCFVSDVTSPDIPWVVQWMKSAAIGWDGLVGERLERALKIGRLKVSTHFYWSSPIPAGAMPPGILSELSGAGLIISKGDINYRRWLGDARWEPATPWSEIIQPPAPLLLLRVLKSDIAAGLKPGQAQELGRQDAAWMVNGRWGMIQFVNHHTPAHEVHPG